MKFKYDKNSKTLTFSHKYGTKFCINKNTKLTGNEIYMPKARNLLVTEYPFIHIRDGSLSIFFEENEYKAIKEVSIHFNQNGNADRLRIKPRKEKIANMTKAEAWVRRNLDSTYKRNHSNTQKDTEIKLNEKNGEIIIEISFD